jgi:hypothetical protein
MWMMDRDCSLIEGWDLLGEHEWDTTWSQKVERKKPSVKVTEQNMIYIIVLCLVFCCASTPENIAIIMD